MKTQIPKVIIALLAGTAIFLAMNFIDKDSFYDYHGIVRSYLIGFYFYPLLLVADLINLLLPISKSLIYKILLNPLYFSFDQINYGHANAIRIGTLIIGIIWTSLLSYIYLVQNYLDKLPAKTRIPAFIITVITATYILSVISTIIFGTPYERLCPGCA